MGSDRHVAKNKLLSCFVQQGDGTSEPQSLQLFHDGGKDCLRGAGSPLDSSRSRIQDA